MSAGPATAHRPAVRRSPSPRVPRRVSGPARGRARTAPARPAPRTAASVALPSVALPRPVVPRLVDVVVALPDARWLDRLLRGRGWIALIGLALIGLVFMQVSMLKMNAGIGQSVEHAGVLERQNADLRGTVSQLSSEERIQRSAADMGMVMPPAGDIRFLQSRGAHSDAVKAARIMRAPNPTAEQAAAAAAAGVAGTTAPTADGTVPPPTEAAAQAAAQEQAAAAAQPQAQAQAAPTTQVQPQQQAAPVQSQATPQGQTAQPQAQATPQQQAQTAAPAAGAAAAPGTGQ